ncbi:MAG TPA: hypothetical protein VEL76_26145 [Gemmataceae bacterium]|nr:hypothetical protein [Gemmataceae bacterium]
MLSQRERRGKRLPKFDHLRLVKRDPAEVQRFATHLRNAQIGEMKELAIEHEHDDSCCDIEPWNATALAIFKAANPPNRIAMVNLPRTGAQAFAPQQRT